MSNDDTPDPFLSFPPLDEPAPAPWRWPAPAFAAWRAHALEEAIDPTCRLETASGHAVDGHLLHFDPAQRLLKFRARADGGTLDLPFARFARLTLPTALALADPDTGQPIDRLPLAAEERDYRLLRDAGLPPLAGRTLGHVQAPEGLYFFPSCVHSHGLQRVFVPREAFRACELGPSACDTAAEAWIADPRALLDALARQAHAPVQPIGQALLHLGLVTPEQLQQALAAPLGDLPLGERLVARGIISAGDLQTAIAHKMGYPVVDLTRFPIEPAALHKLPVKVALACRTVPLMLDGKRLIVAVDRPARLEDLRSRHVLYDLQPVAAVAPKSQIRTALAGLMQQDVWAYSVGVRPGFFPTTQ